MEYFCKVCRATVQPSARLCAQCGRPLPRFKWLRRKLLRIIPMPVAISLLLVGTVVGAIILSNIVIYQTVLPPPISPPIPIEITKLNDLPTVMAKNYEYWIQTWTISHASEPLTCRTIIKIQCYAYGYGLDPDYLQNLNPNMIELHLRHSTDGTTWTEWYDVPLTYGDGQTVKVLYGYIPSASTTWSCPVGYNEYDQMSIIFTDYAVTGTWQAQVWVEQVS